MRIREIISQQGITTKDLADKLGVSQIALNQSISGNPSVKVLTNIADALGVELWELFKAPDATPPFHSLTCPHCGKPLEIDIKKGSE